LACKEDCYNPLITNAQFNCCFSSISWNRPESSQAKQAGIGDTDFMYPASCFLHPEAGFRIPEAGRITGKVISDCKSKGMDSALYILSQVSGV
jgi:hypothetical protein